MRSAFTSIIAFIKRDFLIETSYKASLLLAWINIFATTVFFYYVAKLFSETRLTLIEGYGGRYFPFVFVGLALSGYLKISLITFSRRIRAEQMMGTLEGIIGSPTRILTIIIAMPIWSFLFNGLAVSGYLLFGIHLFSIGSASISYASVFLILILTMVSFAGIGLICAGFIMVFKNGDPLAWAVSIFFDFFGGVFFPVSILPAALQNVSKLLPVTYSIKALRLAFLKGYSFSMLLPYIAILSGFSVVLFFIGAAIFVHSVRRAKLAGTLSHY